MNALAGWGFATPDALERHAADCASREAAKASPRGQARWITPERVEAYAKTLTEVPETQKIMEHFDCCYASALKHRRRIADLIAKQGES